MLLVGNHGNTLINMNDYKRRPRRTFLEIENDIMEATRQLIEENGITNLTLRGVARRAGIEISVFYNRYKDLGELLQKFTEKYDYWYDDIVTSFRDVDFEDYPEYSKELFVSLITGLQKNESIQQLVLWELMEDNSTTRHTNTMREQFTEHIVVAFERYFKEHHLTTNLRVVAGIFIAAIYFIVIHKGQSMFCGVDYNTPEGIQLLGEGIREILDRIYAENDAAHEMLQVARRMKANGICDEVIAECTRLSREDISKLEN